MARARYIKPEFFKDEDLSRLSHAARLLFIGLWSMADRAGRLEDRPLRVKAELFPYEPGLDLAPLLAELATGKAHGNGSFIIRYEVSGRRYIQIANFEKHQKCHVKEPASNLPGPNQASPGKTGPAGANPPESESVSESVDGVGVVKTELARSVEADPVKPTPEEIRQTATAKLSAPPTERERYAREVWEAWIRKRGRGGPEMSSAEWHLVCQWLDAEVPLRVVLQGIADCAGKLDPRKPLLYVKPAVEAEVQRWQRGMTA